MDPNATLQAIFDAIRDGETEEALEALEDLIAWCARGGFAPFGHDADTIARRPVIRRERLIDVETDEQLDDSIELVIIDLDGADAMKPHHWVRVWRAEPIDPTVPVDGGSIRVEVDYFERMSTEQRRAHDSTAA